MTARILPLHRYGDLKAERDQLAAENARLVDALALATADNRMMRATATQANVCLTRLVAALHAVAPNHTLLQELPFLQYRETPNDHESESR